MNGDFGAFLSAKRKEKGFTQKELADKLYISESAVSKWEKNRARPDIALLPILSNILGVTEHELITASVDVKHREEAKQAKKMRTLTNVWHMFFIISYAIATLACLIVNLATSGRLDWFFIVFFSIALAASFTTIPRFIKKDKVFFVPLINLGLLLLLLLTIAIYTSGSWFLLAAIPVALVYVVTFMPILARKYSVKLPTIMRENMVLFMSLSYLLIIIVLLLAISILTGGSWFLLAAVPIIFSYIAIFLPIIIAKSKLPAAIKKYNWLISLTADYIFLLITLLVISTVTGGSWFFTVGLPISSFFFIAVLLIVALMKWLPINIYFRKAVMYFVIAVFCAFCIPFIDGILNRAFGFIENRPMPNLFVWNIDILESNIIAIIVFCFLLTAVIYCILGISRTIKNKNEKDSHKNG